MSKDPMADFDAQMGEEDENDDTTIGGSASQRLVSIIERIERINEEISSLQTDRSDIYAEAKSAGFEVPIIRQIVKARKQDPATREEQAELFQLYSEAVGL